MQRFLAIFAHWLHGLAFAVWVGGILAIGAIAAPAAFDADRRIAALVVGESFRKLNLVAYVCAGIMLAATWAEARVRSEQARRLLLGRAVLTAAALALGLYLGIRLFPMMIGLRTAGDRAAFDRLHTLYSLVTQVQFWLLVAGALITAYLAIPRRPSVRSRVGRDDAVPEETSASSPEHPTPNTVTGAKRP